jgi:hypothetical protein
MKCTITISNEHKKLLLAHLFQSDVEQGAFLFYKPAQTAAELKLEAVHMYLVPPEGWEYQSSFHLALKDEERAKVMKLARNKSCGIIDCHSHIGLSEEVSFSPSDVAGIREFSGYVKWKLDGKPYAALVFSEQTVDAVCWYGDFKDPHRIDKIHVLGKSPEVITPRATWFEKPKFFKKESDHGRKSK